jgi:hypothetical protein
LKPGKKKTISISLTDAGGGAGAWSVSLGHARGTKPSIPASVTVPGNLAAIAKIGARAKEGDGTGFIELRHGTDVRRIPYWLHVERPRLGKTSKTLRRAGTYSGNNSKGKANVTTYRYPEGIAGVGLPGPEQVFALNLTKPVSNFGVRVVSQSRGVTVTPRVVRSRDENRLTGYVGLPIDLNPYREEFSEQAAIAGAILPSRGKYDIVFDSPGRSAAGKFTFRLWINDVTPPAVKLRGYSSGVVKLGVSDSGAGVDSRSLRAFVDSSAVPSPTTFSKGVVSVKSGSLAAGKHTIELVVSDYQEAKNMEDVAQILPNTRDFTATFTVP